MAQSDVWQMLVRKLVAAYLTFWSIAVWLSFPNIIFRNASWNMAEDYILSVQGIALYAVPAIFLYGILVSSLFEAEVVKLKAKGPAVVFLSSLVHVAFGLCFGLVLRSSQLSIIGGVAAFLFFCFDLIIARYILRFKNRLISFAALILPLLLIVVTTYATSPPEPPFTADDAVLLATTGSNGTSIDSFPKEEGQVKLQIGGYDVERETKVEEMARKSTYYVVFTERWRKGEENGQYQMVYEVSHGSVQAHKSSGSNPPYTQFNQGVGE